MQFILGSHFSFGKHSMIDPTYNFSSIYDVSSVMHYSSWAFSLNGKPTITDLDGNPLKTQASRIKNRVLLIASSPLLFLVLFGHPLSLSFAPPQVYCLSQGIIFLFSLHLANYYPYMP